MRQTPVPYIGGYLSGEGEYMGVTARTGISLASANDVYQWVAPRSPPIIVCL